MVDYISIESEIDKQVMEGIFNGTTFRITAMSVGGRYTSNCNAIADERSLRALLIIRNPEICNDRPIILDTRIAVSNIVELHHLLGWDIQKIREEYPYLSEQQIIATLEYYEQNTQEIDEYLKEEKETNVE
ncbi:DUF433 domain-containing protein [Patescibacteria group bacterium]|nr:DUF433 domain-containing protein [Patescibacteria group bacterium]